MQWVYLSFIIIALICLITCFILKIARKRFLAGIFELLSFVFLLAYSIQFVAFIIEFNKLNVTRIMSILFFIFCLILLIYKLFFFLKYKK